MTHAPCALAAFLYFSIFTNGWQSDISHDTVTLLLSCVIVQTAQDGMMTVV